MYLKENHDIGFSLHEASFALDPLHTSKPSGPWSDISILLTRTIACKHWTLN